MSGEDPSYLDGLNPEQREAALHHGPPLLILAGAGSGKTRVITVKIAYLIDALRFNPRDILAVTFTNRAAKEMRERAIGLCPQAEEVMIRTFHSFGAWLLRRNSAPQGLDSRFTIYDDDDAVSLLKSLFPEREKRFLSRYAFLISRAKDYALRPEDPLSVISEDPDFPDIYKAYESRLREIGNADFGDLILRSIGLLRENPEIKSRIHDRFRVIMVDEYQDSNVAQYEFLRELAGPQTYVCVVGDDDQSIYRFRGAEVRNILSFPQNFPKTQVIRLEQNYRSTGSILSAASDVVKNNHGRLGKELWTKNEEGRPPEIVACEDQDAEAAFCLRLLRHSPGLDTAILYRTNAQSRVFETVFLREGLSYRIVGTVRFYEREEIKDAVAFLKFLANPRDEVSFRRIVNKPARGIGASAVEKVLLRLKETQGDILLAMSAQRDVSKGKAGKSLGDFVELCRSLNSLLEKEDLARFVERVIQDSGLVDYHKSQDEFAGSQKLQNLEELVNAATIYGPGPDGLGEFLEGIELDSARTEDQPGNDEGARVTLITMHNTKGLEFDRVIVSGMEEGLFPRGGEESEEDIEEERRLFYVAITRARREVYFSHCKTRRLHGKLLFMEPSRFLEELPGTVKRPKAAARISDGFTVGSTVYHEEYGQGIVWKRWQNGETLMIQVRFDTGKLMQFLPKYERRLEKIAVDGL